MRFAAFAPMFGLVVTVSCSAIDDVRAVAGPQEHLEAEVGDLLFTAVNLARKLGVDAETALAGSTNRFIARFQGIERELRSAGRKVEDTPLDELDSIWEKVKSA